MVKPVLIIGGMIPVIIAILIVVPLVTSPEIPIIAVDPDDIVQIEFTKHNLSKSSFRVTERLGATLVLEKFEENPFLSEFYDDPGRFAFQTQLFFLLQRYQQQQELRQVDMFHNLLI